MTRQLALGVLVSLILRGKPVKMEGSKQYLNFRGYERCKQIRLFQRQTNGSA